MGRYLLRLRLRISLVHDDDDDESGSKGSIVIEFKKFASFWLLIAIKE